MASFKGVRIADLRVNDLRAELENRDLDKTGVKNVLIKRLTEVSIYIDYLVTPRTLYELSIRFRH